MAEMPTAEMFMAAMSIAEITMWEVSMAAMLMISLPLARNADSHSLTEQSLFILFIPSRLKTTLIF